MPISTTLSARGLITTPNNLGATEQGALVEANNVMIRFPDVIEPRRGQEKLFSLDVEGSPYPTDDYVRQVMFFQDKTIINTAGGYLASLPTLTTPSTGWFSADGSRMKSTVAGQNLHLMTSVGPFVLETYDGAPRASGFSLPPDPTTRLLANDPVGFLDPTKRVGYRVVYGRKDVHGTLHLGPPSFPIIATNTNAVACDVYIKIRIDDLPTNPADPAVFEDGVFVQVYRTVQVAASNPSVGDTYGQILEQPLGGVEVTSYLELLDQTPDSFLEFGGSALPLYTNSSQEGPTQGNFQPPFARDVATWQTRTWYSQTELLNSLSLSLLGVGGSTDGVTGLHVGDVLTIAGTAFQAVDTTPGSQQFRIYTSGDAGTNLLMTAKNLVDAINAYAADVSSFTVNAFLESGEAVPPKILLQRNKYANNTSFSVTYRTETHACLTQSLGSNAWVVQTTGTHNYAVGDYVTFTPPPSLPVKSPVTCVVQGPVTATSFRVTTTSSLTGYSSVSRAFSGTAWNPILPVSGSAVSSSNDASPHRVYYSKIQIPEAVPLLNYLDVGTPGKKILRIVPHRDQLLVFKEEGTYSIFGEEPFGVQLLDDTVQLQAIDSVASVGSTVFALVDDGVAAITDTSIQPTSLVIQNQLMPYLGLNNRQETSNAFGVAHESDQLYTLWLPGIEGLNDGKAVAYVYGLRGNAWTTWTFAEEKSCGRVDPFSDTFFSGGITGSFFKDSHESKLSDYNDEDDTPIDTSLTYATSVFGQPAATKQAREAHLHFRQISAIPETGFTFKTLTELLSQTEDVEVVVPSTTSSDIYIGPWLAPVQKRLLIPQEAQRAAYFTFSLAWLTKNTYWALNGFSIVFEGTSERTSK